MFSIKGIPLKLFAALLALIAVAAGVYFTFFQSAGFLETQATIVDIEDVSTDGGASYMPTVEYTVDGTTYTRTLDESSDAYKVGKVITVRYDPNDPSVVHGSGFIGYYLMGVGAAILAVIVVTEIRTKRAMRAVKAIHAESGGSGYPASVPGPERRLYFLSDRGTAKVGHRIEDASRKVLYEAKMTKFTLTTPYGFDFIDHERGKTTPHLIGHEEETDWGNSLFLDSHYTFTLDGEDIWKHLKRSGVTVESSLTGAARAEYRILRDGQLIAVATGSGPNVHEEDGAEKPGLANLVPAQGFYRIRTTETDLSLLFVTLLAFARSGAIDDRGGSAKAILGTVKKLGRH